MVYLARLTLLIPLPRVDKKLHTKEDVQTASNPLIGINSMSQPFERRFPGLSSIKSETPDKYRDGNSEEGREGGGEGGERGGKSKTSLFTK